MIVETLSSVTMSIASIIYATKNVKHLSICCGIFQCTQKSDQDQQIKELETQLEITIAALKRIREKTPRMVLNHELKESENS